MTDEDTGAENTETDDESAAETVAGMYDRQSDETAPDSTADQSNDPENEDTDEKDTPSPRFDAPLLEGSDEPETSTGTFYVKHAGDSAVTLHEVNTSQIATLIQNPGFERHDIIEATLVAQPPMQVSYLIQELESHRSIPVETSPEPPTRQVLEIGEEMDENEAVAIEREGDGEIHILRTDSEYTEHTVEELHDDEMTYKNAARYEVDRVELRSDEERGIVSIRYLPA